MKRVQFSEGLYQVCTVGGVNPAEYGGGHVFIQVDKHGDAEAMLEIVAKGYLYTVCLRDEGSVWDGQLSWVKAKDRASVARTTGRSPTDDDATAWQTGRGTLVQVARIIQDVADYYGWVNLDGYPRRVTRAEVANELWQGAVPAPEGLAELFDNTPASVEDDEEA
jgi:hypothetical protein